MMLIGYLHLISRTRNRAACMNRRAKEGRNRAKRRDEMQNGEKSKEEPNVKEQSSGYKFRAQRCR